jgi:hypothetical protein
MIRALLARAGSRLGPTGCIGVALLVLAAGFHAGTVYPEQKRLQALHDELSAMAKRASKAGDELRSPATDLEAFYAFFPAPDELPDILGKIYGAARSQGLILERGEYRVARSPLDGMLQYQLAFPVRGTYPQIRKFVDLALADVPALSLESAHFERQKIAETAVEAKITLAVQLGRKS